MSVTTALFRVYRPIIGWFAAILIAVELIAVTAILAGVGELRFSFWMVIAGSALKYWTLVVGVMLISINLRQFVTNGVTRREFGAGVFVFLLVVALAFTAAVVFGHALESLVVGAIGQRGGSYPVFGAGDLLRETGHLLPSALAWPLSGALAAVGFYRFRPWVGLLVMVPALVPAGLVEGLLALNEFGVTPERLRYPVALLLSLTVTALGAVAFRLMTRDVPIRRTAG